MQSAPYLSSNSEKYLFKYIALDWSVSMAFAIVTSIPKDKHLLK